MIIPGLGLHPLLADQERESVDGPPHGRTFPEDIAPGESQVAAVNRTLSVLADVDFQMGSEFGKPVVHIIDVPSGRVVRRIPGDQLAELSRRMKALNGLLVGPRA